MTPSARFDNAVKEYATNHPIPKEYHPWDGWIFKGLPMILFRIDTTTEYKWVVQYAGSGRYYKTEQEAREYIEHRTHKGRRARWAQDNRDKIQEYEKQRRRRRFLEEMEKDPELMKQVLERARLEKLAKREGEG